ncbi:MAG TPA: aromatic-ring-hydroxylating dioxygenase subunit beta [Rhizomicrobium sp.]|nr:aromatic-ring-hydroxylating dioxygenase subunit beta [Rhizomicrobium sp.]
MSAIPAGTASLREEVEDFLYYENDLLDRWQLNEWYALFDKNGMYHIVTPGLKDADTASPDNTLFLVSDDMERLAQRIDRLSKSSAHVEFPRSTTSHLISNIRVSEGENGEVVARTRFIIHRTKFDETVGFFGHQIYRLVRGGNTFRIRDKRCVLDFDTLSQQGKVTIIL